MKVKHISCPSPSRVLFLSYTTKNQSGKISIFMLRVTYGTGNLWWFLYVLPRITTLTQRNHEVKNCYFVSITTVMKNFVTLSYKMPIM